MNIMVDLKQKPGTLALDDFLKLYGRIYEHSPWFAETAYNQGNVDTVESLHAAMKSAVINATRDQQLALIRAHPELAVSENLTLESTSEQTGAGLKQCTPEEFAEFKSLNRAYMEKFGFPFIIAVRGLNRQDILKNFRTRIDNDPVIEFSTALEQIHKIALLRLTDLS